VHDSEDATEIMSDFSHLSLSQVVVRDRIAYRKAARDGLCVEELKPKDPKAVEEIEALFKEVFDDE
jgi:chromosome partitioning protein